VYKGPWHQCGDRSHKLVLKQLELGAGGGIILSPRDLAKIKAVEYARYYRLLKAQILIDQQFYYPDFTNDNLKSYDISEYRKTISQLHEIKDDGLSKLAKELESINKELNTDGLIAPAILYEAGRPDIIELNARLFKTSKYVGDILGIPTYATVMLGKSATSSEKTMKGILSQATALNSDGWYFGFEFSQERIPSSHSEVLKCCEAGLILACTGLPVMHAYAGPMALLSLGFGATATAIGHFQNLWNITSQRFSSSSKKGGGGAAPSRLFSKNLWGTIVYPDEFSRLNSKQQSTILTTTCFSSEISPDGPLIEFSKWDANKHLVKIICDTVFEIATKDKIRERAKEAIVILENAVNLHRDIASNDILLRDDTSAYQSNWLSVMGELLTSHSGDYDYLDDLLYTNTKN
jgi:hypothetical protein